MKLMVPDPVFRRNAHDNRKPREVVTHLLMGEPPSCLDQRRREAAERRSEPLKLDAHHQSISARRRA